MKLSESPLLRSFTPEHGAYGKELCHRIFFVYVVFYIRADDGSGCFGAHCEILVPAVEECVHLLFDYIGGLADAPFEELGFFQDGNSYLLDTEIEEYLAYLFFDTLPFRCLIRQYIAKAPYRCYLCHCTISPMNLTRDP